MALPRAGPGGAGARRGAGTLGLRGLRVHLQSLSRGPSERQTGRPWWCPRPPPPLHLRGGGEERSGHQRSTHAQTAARPHRVPAPLGLASWPGSPRASTPDPTQTLGSVMDVDPAPLPPTPDQTGLGPRAWRRPQRPRRTCRGRRPPVQRPRTSLPAQSRRRRVSGLAQGLILDEGGSAPGPSRSQVRV